MSPRMRELAVNSYYGEITPTPNEIRALGAMLLSQMFRDCQEYEDMDDELHEICPFLEEHFEELAEQFATEAE